MITLEQAKNLKIGDILHQVGVYNADNTPRRWKITSIKVWKRDTNRVLIGLKHGLYSYDKITENDLHLVELPE